jgi:thermitase
MVLKNMLPQNSKVEDLQFGGWTHVQIPTNKVRSFGGINALGNMPGVVYVQPNYKIRLLDQPGMNALRNKVAAVRAQKPEDCPLPGTCDGAGNNNGAGSENNKAPAQDNPAIPAPPSPSRGADPLFNNQWGMLDIGVTRAWDQSRGQKNVVVAVIDTGVDYTHEDIVENLWRNAGEMGTDAQGRNKSSNGVDDDGNGYVDDIIGWDFAYNDNKPYDLAVDPMQLIFGGGNPGHGTHCAGNVAARGANGKGVAGVAPNVSIMALRFLTEKGEGSTAGAVQAIAYALRNGAMVTSNSWGSEGEDPADPENKALREIIRASQDKGVLFVAAAGNGHSGVGYDNDNDAKPGYPASYSDDIIISVAALDVNGALGSFSNWGRTTVDIGAPGVKVYSTTVQSNYSDTVLDMFGMKVTWDGTSMATPHVAGAAALYMSKNPSATWQQVKAAIIASATPVASMAGKSVSGGKLNVEALLNH